MAVDLPPNFHLNEMFENLKFDLKFSMSDAGTSSPPSTPSSPLNQSFDIQVLKANDKEEFLKFLRRFFIRDEPLNLDIKLLDDNHSACPELEEYSAKDLDSGVNLKAVYNGKIIGICLNSILHRNYINELESPVSTNKKFEKILKILDHVAKESDVFSHYPDVDKAMTVRILSVDSAWRGKGIAKKLMDITREMAKDLGCKLMTVDCTSHYTAKALQKLGFECLYTLNYDEYKIDDQVVFNPEPPHKAVTVYTQRIQ